MKSSREAAIEYENKNLGKPAMRYETFMSGVEFAQRWIDCSEELPEEGILVQVFNENCNPKYSHSFLRKGVWINPYNDCFLKPTPTHFRYIELK